MFSATSKVLLRLELSISTLLDRSVAVSTAIATNTMGTTKEATEYSMILVEKYKFATSFLPTSKRTVMARLMTMSRMMNRKEKLVSMLRLGYTGREATAILFSDVEAKCVYPSSSTPSEYNRA